MPRLTPLETCLTLGMAATASSTGRVTWFSSSLGAAPLWLTLTVTSGRMMLGFCRIGRRV